MPVEVKMLREEDFGDALNNHLTDETDRFGRVTRHVDKIKRRQCIFIGDYSHKNMRFLIFLESRLLFPG